jgi:hypothetical protein
MGAVRDWMGPSRATIDELAMEYVLCEDTILVKGHRGQRHTLDRKFQLFNEILRRVGPDYGAQAIARAAETLKIVSG